MSKELGVYGHKCSWVTGHRGPYFVCQKAGHAVEQNSYCKSCTCPELKPTNEQPEAVAELVKSLDWALGCLDFSKSDMPEAYKKQQVARAVLAKYEGDK